MKFNKQRFGYRNDGSVISTSIRRIASSIAAVCCLVASNSAFAAYDLIEVANTDPATFPVPIPPTAANVRIFLFAPSINANGQLAFNASASWTENPPTGPVNFGVNALIKHSGNAGDAPELVYVGLQPTDALCTATIPAVKCIGEPGIGGGTLSGAVVNDNGDIAFGTGFFGSSVGETVQRIQKGDGSLPPVTLMQRGQIGDAVYNFPVGNPGVAFNNTGYVASVMWGDCDASQSGDLRAYWVGMGGAADELLNNCNAGETVGAQWPIALQPDGTLAAFPGAVGTDFGVYVADPRSPMTAPRRVGALDAGPFGSAGVRVDINQVAVVAYSGIDSVDTAVERVWYVDSTNMGATPTVVTDSSAEVGINDMNKIAFLGSQPGISSGLFVYDMTTGVIETVLTSGMPYPNSTSTITGIAWWRAGFNDDDELAVQLTLDNDVFSRVVAKLVPSAGVADIDLSDDVNAVDDLTADFGTVALSNTASATLTLSNNGTAPLTINSVGPVAAPFALNDGCTGQTIDPGMPGCTVTVNFSPTQAGNFTDAFEVVSNDPDESPLTFSLSGDVMAPNPAPGPGPGGGGSTNTSDGDGGAVDPFVVALLLLLTCVRRRTAE